MPQQKRAEAEAELVETARRVLPGGGFGNVSHEVVIAEGRAGHVWDVSGNEYIDYLLGSGPMIVGHAHPEVVEVVQQVAAKGTTFFANNEYGIRLAAEIVDAVPCAEQVRFVSTGSEADLYAMRLARAFKGRDKILKFEGGYHGMSDYGLMSLAPKRAGNFPQPIPDSAGIPKSLRDEMLVAPFNDLETVASLVREHKDELAGIIVEPFQRLIPPKPGFLEGLRKITARQRPAADLRRGRHRLPLRLRRRPGLLRRHARHLHAGQGHRRRLSAGGHRRPRRHHGPLRQGRRRRGCLHDADRHALRQSDRRGCRPEDAGDPEAARRLRADLQDGPRADGGLHRDSRSARGSRRAWSATRPCSTSSSRIAR